jgi:hypothetical protein
MLAHVSPASSQPWRELSVLEVLSGKHIIRATQTKNKELEAYVAHHSAELLEHAFSNPEEAVSKNAFLLLSQRSKVIVDSMFQDDVFLVKATDVLMKPEVPACLISRLATLFANVIMKSDSRMGDSIGFLLHLLRFVSEASVFEMFIDLCAPVANLTRFQLILVQARFSGFVVNEFQKAGSNEKMANLCSIVHRCLENPILHASFATEAMLSCVSPLLQSGDIEVLNQAWQAISIACNEVTVSKMMDLKDLALETISKIGDLHLYHACAVDLLTMAVRYAPAWFGETQREDLIRALVHAIDSFPNATNLIAAVFRCLRNAAKSSYFLGLVLLIGFPVLITHAQATTRNSASAFATEFLAAAWQSRGDSKVVKQFLMTNQPFIQLVQQKLLKILAIAAEPVPQSTRRKLADTGD